MNNEKAEAAAKLFKMAFQKNMEGYLNYIELKGDEMDLFIRDGEDGYRNIFKMPGIKLEEDNFIDKLNICYFAITTLCTKKEIQ